MGVVRFVFLLAVGLWVGEIVFFSFVVAPAVFGVLDSARAGAVVGAVFPRYYALGTAAGTVAVVAAVVIARQAARSGWWTGVVVALLVGLAVTVGAGLVVHPRAQRLRVALQSAGKAPAEDPGFRRAHQLAVGLNAAALVAVLTGLGLAAGALRE
ncbi:MAG TPA: DUF4149 domain-containing protein [Candidatus Binatia bacterium]|nr:DUF4149 domain-containing protein [Candidatus Binatia bacterium]